MVRIPKLISEQEQAREAAWLEAIESNGMTQAELAAMVGLSQGQVSRRLARARQARDQESAELTSSPATTTPTPEASELPRLVLTDSESHDSLTTNAPSSGSLRYALATDAVSLDGVTWIPADDPATPRMPVLASNGTGRGLRRHRLEPRPLQAPPEPPGPTSHRKTPGLRGGRG